jgi:hypothetical protein
LQEFTPGNLKLQLHILCCVDTDLQTNNFHSWFSWREMSLSLTLPKGTQLCFYSLSSCLLLMIRHNNFHMEIKICAL